ncbi:MAG: hypothetical protein ACTSSH_04315 [Candidatus Heimdallarchaeota archaeon]
MIGVNETSEMKLQNPSSESPEKVITKPNRYVTIDFLRGIAILGMLAIHLMLRIWDYSWTNDFSVVPVFFIIFAVILVFIGSWRGLFALISGVGNMIKMQRARKKGVPLWSIVLKQVTNGFFLLTFAMLSEGLIGYDGWFSRSIQNGGLLDIGYFLGRLNHFHTVHSIAWCLIINALLYGALMWKKRYEKTHQNAIIYALLAIVVIFVTTPIWNAMVTFNPSDNHYFTNWLNYDFWYGLKAFFAAPLAGSPQPLFPFLTSLFVGNIIGLYLAEEKPPKKLPMIGLIVGGVIILAGVIFGLVLGATSTEWFPMAYPERLTKLTVWQPWFLFGLGSQIILFMLMLRFIEYRGKGEAFARKTTFIRRFGIIPFTIYNFQWLELLPRWIIGLILGINLVSYPKVNTFIMLIVMIVVLGLWYVILLLWEKVGYIGSFEWSITKLTRMLTRKRKKSKRDTPELISSKQNMKGLVRDVHWIDLTQVYSEEENQIRENRLITTSAILGIFFFPFILTSYFLLRKKKVNAAKKLIDWQIQTCKIFFYYSILQFILVSLYLLQWTGVSL